LSWSEKLTAISIIASVAFWVINGIQRFVAENKIRQALLTEMQPRDWKTLNRAFTSHVRRLNTGDRVRYIFEEGVSVLGTVTYKSSHLLRIYWDEVPYPGGDQWMEIDCQPLNVSKYEYDLMLTDLRALKKMTVIRPQSVHTSQSSGNG